QMGMAAAVLAMTLAPMASGTTSKCSSRRWCPAPASSSCVSHLLGSAGGLTEQELMEQLEHCELAPPAPSAPSRGCLPSPSPRISLTSLHSASSNSSLSGHRGSPSPPQAEARRRGGGSFVERCQELVRSGPDLRRPPTPAPWPSTGLGPPLTPPKVKLNETSF
ncbi:SHKBP1 isoform 26, partial [Pongo abelii]